MDSKTILMLSDVKYDGKQDFYSFYFDFRWMVDGFMKRKGDVYRPENSFMLEDEEMSPTLEDVIIVWCLEKIDPSLPKLVNQTFSKKIKDDYSLLDIQEDIFEMIPYLLKNNSNGDNRTKVGFTFDDKVKEELEGCDNFKNQDDRSIDVIKDNEIEPDLIIKHENLIENEDIFNEEATLVDDVKKVLESLNISCSICSKSFKSEKHLIWHQRYHQIDTEPSSCNICSKSFDSRYRLDKHKVIHRFENCTCAVCDKSFDSSKSLKLHVNKHHKKDINCRKCGKVCANYTKYLTHIAKPHDQDCPKSNVKEENSAHDKDIFEAVRKKRGRKPKAKILGSEIESSHQCSECGKSFEKEKLLLFHQRYHQVDSVPSLCSICGKSFASKYKLEKHKTKHKIGSITCDVCQEVFYNRRSLLLHASDHHKGDIACRWCKLSFLSYSKFLNHKKLMHGGKELYGKQKLKLTLN